MRTIKLVFKWARLTNSKLLNQLKLSNRFSVKLIEPWKYFKIQLKFLNSFKLPSLSKPKFTLIYFYLFHVNKIISNRNFNSNLKYLLAGVEVVEFWKWISRILYKKRLKLKWNFQDPWQHDEKIKNTLLSLSHLSSHHRKNKFTLLYINMSNIF